MQAGFRFVSALIRPWIDLPSFSSMYRQLYYILSTKDQMESRVAH